MAADAVTPSRPNVVLIISDDLEMKAVANRYSPRELVEGSFAAGVDALLVCRSAELRDDVLARDYG